MNDSPTQALASFREAVTARLGDDAYLAASDALQRYGASTIATNRTIAGAVCVRHRDDVVTVVNASREHKIPLYPISTGRNWGYGSAQPAADNCVVLDLSRLNRIVSVNAQSGVAVLEPGVTQQALRDYLDENELPFLCPVTGAGPSCSLVGNALERGYGITPIADHFLAVTSLEAVLPDGTVYRPPMAAAGCTAVDQSFKWGVGPYLDGMFTQSAFGVVTEMTIRLAATPDVVNAFFFAVERDDQLEATVMAVSKALREAGGVLGSINLMNTRRVVAMMAPYRPDKLNAHGILDGHFLDELAAENQVSSWMGAGALYGNKALTAAARTTVKEHLRGKVKRLFFFSPKSVKRFYALSKFLPFRQGRGLEKVFETLSKTLEILAGAPSTVALPLAYWKTASPPPNPDNINPAQDGCGLIWYSPLVPMEPSTVRKYTDMVERVCTQYGIEPLITLTSLSDSCFDSTVPILFDPDTPGATENAHACYAALLEEGREIGCTPYRAPISAMGSFVDSDVPYWKLVAKIKKALDPDGLISPGRYTA